MIYTEAFKMLFIQTAFFNVMDIKSTVRNTTEMKGTSHFFSSHEYLLNPFTSQIQNPYTITFWYSKDSFDIKNS